MPLNFKKVWVRKDRDQYIMMGVVVAFIITSYAMSRWNSTDAINAYRHMRVVRMAETENAGKNIREAGLSVSRRKSTTQKYYKVEQGASPEIPGLGEQEGE